MSTAQALKFTAVTSAAADTCDFCIAPMGAQAYVMFGCADFTHDTVAVQGVIRVTHTGGWAACRRCAPMVRARLWKPLISRSIRVQRAAGWTGNQDLTHRTLAALCLKLERHLTGDATVRRPG